MNCFLELAGATLEQLKLSDETLSVEILCFSSKTPGEKIKLFILLKKPKYKKLPESPTTVDDGELYGIFGSPLNGCLPDTLEYPKEVELIFTIGGKDYEIHAASLEIALRHKLKREQSSPKKLE